MNHYRAKSNSLKNDALTAANKCVTYSNAELPFSNFKLFIKVVSCLKPL